MDNDYPKWDELTTSQQLKYIEHIHMLFEKGYIQNKKESLIPVYAQRMYENEIRIKKQKGDNEEEKSMYIESK